MSHTIHMHTFLEILISLIMKQYFNSTYCIVHYHDNPDNLVHIHRFPMISRMINGIENLELDVNQKCRLFLLQCDDAREAFEATEIVIRTDGVTRYNNRQYIIIVNSEKAFQDLFNSTDLSFVRDVLVINIANKTDDFQGNVYTYHRNPSNDSKYPSIQSYDLYTHKFVGENGNNDPILLDTWFSANYSYKYGNNLLPDKITNNYGRELRAPCMNLIPYALCISKKQPLGNEYNTIIEYSKRYNFTLNIYINESHDFYGEVYDNWTGYGVLGRLVSQDYDDYCEIVYGGFPFRGSVDVIRTIRYSYIVSAPLPMIKYGYFMFMEVFNVEVWLIMVIMYFVIRLLVFLQSKYLITPNVSGTKISSLTLYGLMINQPLAISTDIQNSLFLKYVVLIVVIGSVWMVTAYNSRLASVMVTPVLENDINTLTELSESNFQLLFFDAYYSIMEEDERKVYKTLYEKIDLIPNATDIVETEEYLSSRKYAVARYRRRNGEYFEHAHLLEQMEGKYKPVTPELFTDYYYILLRKNSIHTERLQKLVSRLDEVGLLQFWEEDALRWMNETIFHKKMQEYSKANYKTKINMYHLKGIFTFWFFGMCFSILLFMKELLFHRNIPRVLQYNN